MFMRMTLNQTKWPQALREINFQAKILSKFIKIHIIPNEVSMGGNQLFNLINWIFSSTIVLLDVILNKVESQHGTIAEKLKNLLRPPPPPCGLQTADIIHYKQEDPLSFVPCFPFNLFVFARAEGRLISHLPNSSGTKCFQRIFALLAYQIYQTSNALSNLRLLQVY